MALDLNLILQLGISATRSFSGPQINDNASQHCIEGSIDKNVLAIATRSIFRIASAFHSPVRCQGKVRLRWNAREQDDQQEEHQEVLQSQVDTVQETHHVRVADPYSSRAKITLMLYISLRCTYERGER